MRGGDSGGVRLAAAASLAMVAALAALPLALRPPEDHAVGADERLVVITPHDENTRAEFARAFAAWTARERGAAAAIEWLTPGGTADIQRVLASRYAAALARTQAGGIDGFDDPRGASPARAAFLAGDAGIGIDVYWGGGEPAFRRAAEQGFLVDAGLLRDRPDWFGEQAIPAELGGERVYDAAGRWYGACLTGLGIAWNPDRLAQLADPRPPLAWSDLGEARLRGLIVIADPARSAAAAGACERLIQQQMALAAGDGADEPRARALGWERGFALIRRIVANARGIEDAVSKPPRAVARGEAVAAVCLDFQARGEADYAEQRGGAGADRLRFAAPAGGATVGADPIGLLRGSPRRALAVDLIRFVLSPEGQRLWDYRPGEPGGPVRWALRRAPVRRDVYTAADRARMSDPELDPFAVAAASTWRGERTAAVARLVPRLITALAIDPAPELRAAWGAIAVAGGPERVPEAWRAFTWLPVPYDRAVDALARLDRGPAEALPSLRAWTDEAIARYREAARLARAGR